MNAQGGVPAVAALMAMPELPEPPYRGGVLVVANPLGLPELTHPGEPLKLTNQCQNPESLP